MSRTSRVALAAATVPLALGAAGVGLAVSATADPAAPSTSAAASSPFGSSAGEVRTVGRSSRPFRTVGATIIPPREPAAVTRAKAKGVRVTRQVSPVAVKKTQKVLGVPLPGKGINVLSVIAESSSFSYRWNNLPRRGRAIIDLVSVTDITPAASNNTELGFGAKMSMKVRYKNGRKAGFPVCKGTVNWTKACNVDLPFSELDNRPKPGQEKQIAKTGCTTTGNSYTIHCAAANYDEGQGANVRAGTQVSQVETTVVLTKGGLPGSSLSTKVKAKPLGRPRTPPKARPTARAVAKQTSALAPGQTASAVAYVAPGTRRGHTAVIVARDDEQAKALPSGGEDAAAARRAIALEGGEAQSGEVSFRNRGAGAPAAFGWDGRTSAPTSTTGLAAGCRVRLTWTADGPVTTRHDLLRTAPTRVDVDRRQCAKAAAGA